MKLLMTIVAIALLAPSFALAKAECGSSLIKSLRDGEEIVISSRICVNAEERNAKTLTSLVSENCMKQACFAHRISSLLQPPKRIKRGSIGFDDCKDNGGAPESIQFQWNKKWHKTSRCLFKVDQSFIDTGSLVGRGPFTQPPLELREKPQTEL